MDKTIETKFFEAFSFGGVVAHCIEWMRYTYNLPCVKGEASTKDTRKLNEKWVKYYEETLPESILEATNAFNFDVIDCIDSPLMDEIEGNLKDCKTDTQKENYLFSLLLPFGNGWKGCGYARVFNPKTEMEQKDWALYVNRQFCEILNKADNENSVEYCLHRFSRAAKMFADRLDALLLTYGIDLLRLQRECGVYLKEYRIITDVDLYIGSRELAQRYIDALPKDNARERLETAPEGAVILPDANNEKVKKTRGRGRPKETFKDKLIGDAEGEKLQKLHLLIDGRKGKAVSLVILASIKKGWLIEKPTFTQVKDEFGDIGTQQGFANYLDENKFTKEELEGAINSLV